MPATQERFQYKCAKCGRTINDALGVFSPVSNVPSDAVIAVKPPS